MKNMIHKNPQIYGFALKSIKKTTKRQKWTGVVSHSNPTMPDDSTFSVTVIRYACKGSFCNFLTFCSNPIKRLQFSGISWEMVPSWRISSFLVFGGFATFALVNLISNGSLRDLIPNGQHLQIHQEKQVFCFHILQQFLKDTTPEAKLTELEM